MNSFDAGVYDVYDDGGLILKNAVPDMSDIPEYVKTAAVVGHDDDAQNYALVMLDEGKVMKKFATADAGNTWMSSLYFAFTHGNLPEEAQKVAAANLLDACDAFDIAAPNAVLELAAGPAESNFVDVSGASLQVKVASDERTDVEYAITRADGSQHYPLRNAADVTTAMDYFDRNAGDFVPRERREFAVKVASVASRGFLPLTEKVAARSGTDWNPSIEGHITARYLHLTDRDADIAVKERLVKLAALRSQVEPSEFADALERFDVEQGLDALWDKEVADPWYSTFGMNKVAKGSVPAPESFSIGEVTVTTQELLALAERGRSTLATNFGEAFAVAYCKNPIEQFNALPVPNRKLLARMATTHADDSTSS